MNACELTLSVTALANALAKQLDNSQLALLGSVLNQLGDTLATISIRRESGVNSSGADTGQAS